MKPRRQNSTSATRFAAGVLGRYRRGRGVFALRGTALRWWNLASDFIWLERRSARRFGVLSPISARTAAARAEPRVVTPLLAWSERVVEVRALTERIVQRTLLVERQVATALVAVSSVAATARNGVLSRAMAAPVRQARIDGTPLPMRAAAVTAASRHAGEVPGRETRVEAAFVSVHPRRAPSAGPPAGAGSPAFTALRMERAETRVPRSFLESRQESTESRPARLRAVAERLLPPVAVAESRVVLRPGVAPRSAPLTPVRSVAVKAAAAITPPAERALARRLVGSAPAVTSESPRPPARSFVELRNRRGAALNQGRTSPVGATAPVMPAAGTRHFPVAALAAPTEPPLPAVRPSRLAPRRPAVDALPVVERREKALDVTRLQATVTRHVEETVRQRVVESVKTVVERELSPESAFARRLSERLYGGLYENLLLERERLGWG